MNQLTNYTGLLLTGPEVKRTFEEGYLKLLFAQYHDLDKTYILEFLHMAQLSGASIVQKQIFLTSYFNQKLGRKVGTVVFSYHHFLNMANQTGEMRGLDVQTALEDVFYPCLGKTIQELVATATVKREGRGATVYKARWSEFYNDKSEMWKKKSYAMLEKCAISNVLRWAFPEALSGMFIEEEISEDNYEANFKIEDPNAIEVGQKKIAKDEKIMESAKDSKEISEKSKAIITLLDKIKLATNQEKALFLRSLGVSNVSEFSKKSVKELNAIADKIIESINNQDKVLTEKVEAKNDSINQQSEEWIVIESIKKSSSILCEGFTPEQKTYFMKNSIGVEKFNDLYAINLKELKEIEAYLVEKSEVSPKWGE